MRRRHGVYRLATISALGLLLSSSVFPLPSDSATARAAPSPVSVPPLGRPAVAPQPKLSLSDQPSQVRHVVIISEDGMRPDLIYGQQNMVWHEQLYRNGSFSWKARTIRTASTLPSHASMLSGVDVDQHGLTWNTWLKTRGFIRVPTIFQAAEENGLKTAVFVGKPKLRHIMPEGTVGTFARPGYYCKKVSDEAARYIEREKPELLFVHFSDPDEAGHSDGWMTASYRKAALASDACLGTIYRALQQAHMIDETLVIVSADHGGHARGHTGAIPSDREIPWIASGPGVRRGYHIRSAVSTMDTAATALAALGLAPLTRISGRPVSEIFQPATRTGL